MTQNIFKKNKKFPQNPIIFNTIQSFHTYLTPNFS